MLKSYLIPLTCSLFHLLPASADVNSPLSYDLQLTFERSAFEGIGLGDDPETDRLTEEDLELEIDLEYRFSPDLTLFFTGALIDETETIHTSMREETRSGLERKEMGIRIIFGQAIESEIALGRVEFENQRQHWSWWDEELDAIRLDTRFDDFEATLGLAEEFAPETTDDDFIDPDLKDVQRIIFNINWEFVAGQTLALYYLDQSDESSTYQTGQFVETERVDEEDADLSWKGISYLGEFAHKVLGDFEIELHYAQVSGDTVLYELDDPVAGQSEVSEQEMFSVKGSARGYFLSWRPPFLPHLSLTTGRAMGSGDSNPDDMRIKSFRQTGLQEDTEAFGEFYQPELSNIDINLFGMQWDINENLELSLYRYEYHQRHLSDELRDTSLEIDPSGSSKDLGQEVDLAMSVEQDDFELIVTIAEFNPGRAYATYPRQSGNFIKIELVYDF